MGKRSDFQNDTLRQIWVRFNANIGSLLSFVNEGTSSADQMDQELIRKKSKEIADLFDEDPHDIELELTNFIPSLDSIEIEPLFLDNADVRTTIEAFQTGDFQRQAMKWYRENPRKGIKFLAIFNSMFEELPASGVLLRRSVLVILVSFLGQLFLDLFVAYYTVHPKPDLSVINPKPGEQNDPDSAPEINLSEAQVQANKSMRGGIGERIKRLEAVGVDCSILTSHLVGIQEIIQRRNLFVHKDGIIDQQYLDRILVTEAQEKGFAVGKRLVVSTSYLRRAIETVSIFGLLLHQLCMRKWVLVTHSKADEIFNSFLYQALKNKRYHLVIELVENSSSLNLDQKYRKIVKVNYGIAFREIGDSDQLDKIILELNRSRPDATIKMAIAILRQDFPKAHRLLLDLAKRNKRKFETISMDWPLFKPINEEVWFCNLFKTEWGELPHKK